MVHLEDSQELSINLLREAYYIASKNSPDPSTKVGAILLSKDRRIIAMAYNTPIVKLSTSATREEKYMGTSHAEERTISIAARSGECTLDSVLYCPWAACHDCAKVLATAGVKEVIVHGDAVDMTPERWKSSMSMSMKIFKEWNVKYTKIYGKIGNCENLFDGKIWYP